tara:strand:- start:4181 stop:4690 length:510 start_codon:yes stop_codon:yes gene_type:complete
MEKEKEYYQPKIEEFHVGFKYEYKDDRRGWEERIVEDWKHRPDGTMNLDYCMAFKSDRFRVEKTELKRYDEVKQKEEWKDESCSAFAFKVSKEIESFITDKTNNLEETNKILEDKILSYYIKSGKSRVAARHFGIKTSRGECTNIHCDNGIVGVIYGEKLMCTECQDNE